MCAFTRWRPCDPLTFAVAGRDAAVKRSGQLQSDKRSAEPKSREKTGIDLGGLLGTEPGLDSEPRRTQLAKALAGNPRVGILQRDDHPLHSCGNQGVDAGWRLTPMAAGFETDIGGGTASRQTRSAQRFGLAMRASSGLCPAASDDFAAINNDTTDRGVGPDCAEPAAR